MALAYYLDSGLVLGKPDAPLSFSVCDHDASSVTMTCIWGHTWG